MTLCLVLHNRCTADHHQSSAAENEWELCLLAEDYNIPDNSLSNLGDEYKEYSVMHVTFSSHHASNLVLVWDCM